MSYKLDINTPGVSKLNNDEYAQLVKEVLKITSTVELEHIGVRSEVVLGIEKNLDLLTEASRQSRSSKESESIAQLDKERNNLVSYLLWSFRVNRKSSLEIHKIAAQELFIAFKNYKGVSTLPSRQKSQVIDAMLKDLQNPEYVVHLNTLNLGHATPALQKVNASYQELVGVRSESRLSINEINVKKVRKDTNALLKELMLFAFATHTVRSTSESTTFINILNTTIDNALMANKQRLAQLTANKRKNE